LPKLDLRIYPRYNLYLSSEKTGSFIVDTPVQTLTGQYFKNVTWEGSTKKPFTELALRVTNNRNNDILVNWKNVSVNSWGNEIEFDLTSMPADREHPWSVSAIGASPDAALQTFHSGASVTVLPDRNDSGSVARIDYLYGGIEVKSSLTNGKWKPIYPYSFYTSWDWIMSTMRNASSTKNLRTFRESGYNLIHPVPPGGTDPFDEELFEQFLKICDDIELYVMYDMRHTYKNNTSVATQLARLQQHPSLLLYYTADEPDGWCDPLNATTLSYDHIKTIDPYHPVSLVLNCANFYFKEYTSGADIILEDTYPIAVNTSFSNLYNTPCNTTYGDCGCDNCHANDPAFPAYTENAFLDIIERTQNLQTYQEWIGTKAKKPTWGVPQAFYDRGSFWGRFPTREEEAIMGILRLNHGAKGIVAWIYPTSEDIEDVTSELARVLASEDVTRFTLGAKRSNLATVGGGGLVDATAWVLDDEVLLSYAYVGYEGYTGSVKIELPVRIIGEISHLWGSGEGWQAGSSGTTITKEGYSGLEVGIAKLQRERA
jgi:hypothetical protein